MSRRPPALTLIATLCLLLLAFGTPLLAQPVRAYGEHVFESNTVIGPGDPFYPVYDRTTLAQSFSVTQDYILANVTLRVRNDGGGLNSLLVSIHPDDPNGPGPVMSTQLANSSWVTPDNQTAPVDWDFPLYPAVTLRAGSVYWIVAENDASLGPPAGGYEWHQSGADTYPGGSAFALNTTSGLWTGLPYDLYFVTFGRGKASNVSLAMTADRVDAQPGDTVTFTVAFNNTGTDAAPRAWINTTLPGALVNLSVSFPGVQPVSAAAFPDLTFPNVTSGPHAFLISAQIDIGTTPGSVLTALASLDFQNATGALTRGRQASAELTVGLVTKQLYLGSTSVAVKLLTTTLPTAGTPASSSINPGAAQPTEFILSPSLARPFLADKVSASLWVSTQKAPPQSYKLNVSLLDNGTPVVSLYPVFTISVSGYHLLNLSSGEIGYTFAYGHQIGLSLWSVGGGGGSTDNLLLRYNATAYRSHLELVTPTYVAVTALQLEDPVANATVWSPLDPIAVLANISDPFGASRISGAWINITAPAGNLVVAAPMILRMTDGSGLPAWKLFNYTLTPPLVTGEYRVDVTAVEDNGVVDLARAFAEVAEPSFTLADVSSTGRSHATGAYAYYLYYNNSGTGAAGNVWINETLPSEVSYAASSIPYTSSSGNRYAWALGATGLGSHRLEVDVSVLASSVAPAWIRDNVTLEFTDGSGHAEEPLAAHANVFLNGPVIAVGLTATPSGGVHGNETVVYVVHLQNTGADAGALWMNDTMPAGFTYLSDDAGLLGAGMIQVGPRLLYTFPGMPGGADWTVQISLRAAANIVLNDTYSDVLEVNYTSTNGYLMPPETAVFPLPGLRPWIAHGGAAFLTPRTSPGGKASVVVSIQNAGDEPAPWVWVNLTLDPLLTMTDASRNFASGTGFARFVLPNVGIGWTAIFLNVSVSQSAVDGMELPLGGEAQALDGFGNRVPTLTLTRAFLFVTAASFRLSADPLDPTIEAGMAFPLAVATSNIGSGNAANAWLNLTVPGTLEYVNDTADVDPVAAGLGYSWHWKGSSPTLLSGSLDAFTLTVRARAVTPSGTTANLTLRLEYQDADFLPRAALTMTVRVTVVAPAIYLRVDASQASVASGGTFNYTVRLENRGLSVAHRVWLQDTLDPNLQLVSYSSDAQATGNGTLNWTFTDLGPGAVEIINLTVRTASDVGPDTFITNSVEATYTNSAGASLGSMRSLPVTVRISEDLTPLAWLGGIAAIIAGVLLLVLTRRNHVEIEEAFLVYRDGVLISHLSRSLMREKDEDVLSGMLTAVQEFVREAFQYGEHRDLQQLDFGEYRILIERGKYVYLAVVYAGKESEALRKKVRGVIDLVEKQFGKVLEKWDGDMEEVVGARDLIRDSLLGTGGRNHGAPTAPEYE